jgi:hypothetical protein
VPQEEDLVQLEMQKRQIEDIVYLASGLELVANSKQPMNRKYLSITRKHL